MTETTGSGGLNALALGGIGATVVVVGGAVMVWLGVFDKSPDQNVISANNAEIAITPSAQPPIILKGTTPDPDPVVSAPKQAPPQEGAIGEPENTGNTAADAAEVVETQGADTVAAEQNLSLPETDETELAETLVITAKPQPAQELTSEAAVAQNPDASQEAGASTTAVPNAAETGAAEQSVVQTTQSATEGATEAASATEGSANSESAADSRNETAVLEAPKLDLVRVDPTGETVIAGRAPFGAQVSVLLDGKVLEEIDVAAGGEFVAFASIPPSTMARVISLRAAADGRESLSETRFIIAPVAKLPASVAADVQAPSTTSGADVVAEEGGAENEANTTEETGTAVASSTEESIEQTGSDIIAQVDAEADPEAEPAAMAPVTLADAVASTVAPSEPVAEPTASAIAEGQTNVAQPDATVGGSAEQTASAETKSAPQPEPTQVAVLRADATGVTLVQPVAQARQSKVVLDTISYSDNGEVQIAGRAGADTQVRAYLDNAPVANFVVAENGSWGGGLEAVAPGVYSLRLDELGEDGKVLSRLETPFKREAPEALLAPASEDTAPGVATPLVRAITVQKGDTLWAISQQRYGNGFLYVRVFEANHDAIRDPDLIYPGQVFTIPE